MTELKLFEDRSGLEDHAACPRKRWWRREWGKGDVNPFDQEGKRMPGGLEPRRKSIYLVLGGAVHHGLNALMLHVKNDGNAMGEAYNQTVEIAADLAVEFFDGELARAGLGGISIPDVANPEQQDWKTREARALVEGLVMVAGYRLIPNLVERFEVVEVETERRFELGRLRRLQYWEPEIKSSSAVLVAVPIIFESRADALLREKETGDLYVHSWKTSADYGKLEEDGFRRDAQGITEAIAIEKTGQGERVMGVQMAFLLKGRKYEHKQIPGMKIHYSPITRAFRKFAHGILPGQDLSEWAWSWDVPKVNQKTGQTYIGNLGKDWEAVATFEAYSGGVRKWVTDLLAGKWQREAGDPFAGSLAMPEPWFRAEEEVEDWLEQAKHISEGIHIAAERVREAERVSDWAKVRKLLNGSFPQNRKSCENFYGGQCQFSQLCWGSAEGRQNPLGEGVGFRVREPHHSLGEDEVEVAGAAVK